MKKKFAILILFLSLLSFTGCDADKPAGAAGHTEFIASYPWVANHSPIPAERTGLYRQGIYQNGHSFETTESGVYFLCQEFTEDGWLCSLLYGDHGSNTLLKLCGRPDCTHDNFDCNACFGDASNVCYDNGYLYVLEFDRSYYLTRLDLDGGNRMRVFEATPETDVGSSIPTIWNGVLTMYRKFLDEAGAEVIEPYYYHLNSDMDEMIPTRMHFPWGNDGTDNFITFLIGAGSYADTEFYLWDSETGQETYLTNLRSDGEGYYGAEEAYYIRDGVIYRLTYADNMEEALFDTGLEGSFGLHCFPDCLVLSTIPSYEQEQAVESIAEHILYFYNWDFEFLGQVELDYPRQAELNYSICGETAERIILTDNLQCVPRYYIEKSDFGTGNIEIHAYNLPDFAYQEFGE